MHHQPDEHVQTAERLTAEWFTLSHERLGVSRQTWYHPAVEHLIEAVWSNETLDEALIELAAARGSAGLDLRETLVDLEHLLELLPQDRRADLDRLATARCLDAWSEAFLGTVQDRGCTDALTGLASVDYLRVRMQEAVRHCRSLDIALSEAYVVLVVRAAHLSSSPFVRMTDRIRAARATRAHFPAGETIALDDEGTIFVLASNGPHLPARAAELVDTLGAGSTADIRQLRSDDDLARPLLDDLTATGRRGGPTA